MTNEEFNDVVDAVTARTAYATKKTLTSDEAAAYLGISKSYLYKLTMSQQIPHYKPLGKMCYFDRAELDEWVRRNRIATHEEISSRAAAYCREGARA